MRKQGKLTVKRGWSDDSRIRRVFRQVDTDGSGTITVDELQAWMGPAPTSSAVREHSEHARSSKALSALRSCSRGKLDLDIASLRQKLMAAAFVDGKQDLARLMGHLDRDNNGSINFDEFRRGSRSTGKLTIAAVSDTQLKQVFDFIDMDQSGEIQVAEFIKFLRSTQEELDQKLHDGHLRAAPGRAGSFRGSIF